MDHKADIAERNIASMRKRGKGQRMMLALVNKDRLVRILEKMLDEDEFLSDHGIRSYVFSSCYFVLQLKRPVNSLSKKHKDHPWGMDVHGQRYEVNYWPGDSKSGMFGGNSNWRGPICMFALIFLIMRRKPITLCTGLAVNFLLIESLQRFYQYYGDEIQVESSRSMACPESNRSIG